MKIDRLFTVNNDDNSTTGARAWIGLTPVPVTIEIVPYADIRLSERVHRNVKTHSRVTKRGRIVWEIGIATLAQPGSGATLLAYVTNMQNMHRGGGA